MGREPRTLHLETLGGFRLRDAASGNEVTVVGRKAQALLTFLALHNGQRVPRERIAALLWGDMDDAHARGNLRLCLHGLRRNLGDFADILHADRNELSLDATRISVDVVAIRRGQEGHNPADWDQSLSRYRGPFLDGLITDSSGFDDWVRETREHFLGAAIDLHNRLLRLETGEARIRRARQLLDLDRLRENSHAALIQALAAHGEREAALRQYQLCRDLLKSELDVEPSEDLNRLIDSIGDNGNLPACWLVGRSLLEMSANFPATEWNINPDTAIAVMPFESFAKEDATAIFANVLADQLISALSRCRELYVVARVLSAAYIGGSTRNDTIARELGVRYLLTGSVHANAHTFLIIAQLVDTVSRTCIWSEKFSCYQAGTIAPYNETVRSITTCVDTQIKLAAWRGKRSDKQEHIEPTELARRAVGRLYDMTSQGNADAEKLVERALFEDPDCAMAHRVRGTVFVSRLAANEIPHDAISVEKALNLCRYAIELAPYDECAHWTLAFALAEAGRLEEALYACDAGMSLNPNNSLLLADKGDYLGALGRTKQAIETCGLALQLDPRYPVNYWWENSIASARFLRGEHAEALSLAKTVALKKPAHVRAGIVWAASAAASRNAKEAKQAVQHLAVVAPDLNLNNVMPDYTLALCEPKDAHKLMDCLALAGLKA